MWPIFLLASAIVSVAPADKEITSAPRPRLRVSRDSTWIGPGGTLVSPASDGSVSAVIQLERVQEDPRDAQAQWMSLGPRDAAEPTGADTMFGASGLNWIDPWYKRLRVTISACEGSLWLTIDEVKVARADTRTVAASYRLHPWYDPRVGDLRSALRKAPRVHGNAPANPIEWIDSRTFAYVMGSDTLVLRQQDGAEFLATLKPRSR